MHLSKKHVRTILFGTYWSIFGCSIALGDATWTNPPGGSFQDGTNWSTGTPPGVSDNALFELSTVPPVPVSFSADVTNHELIVDGTAAFDLGGHTYTSNGPPTQERNPGVTVNGSLFVQNGTMNALLDNSINGYLQVSGSNTQWLGTLGVYVGGRADITGGALLNSEGAGLTNGGTINLSGVGTEWLATSYAITASNGPTGIQGSLSITDGAQFQSSQRGTLDFSSATVSGVSGSARSTFNFGNLQLLNATVNITNGASSSGSTLGFGMGGSDTSTVTVGQAGGGFNSQLNLTSGIFIDQTSGGKLIVNPGGQVSTSALQLNGGGGLDVNGGSISITTLLGQGGSINLNSGSFAAGSNETMEYGFTFNQNGGNHILLAAPSGTNPPAIPTLTIMGPSNGVHTTYNLSGGNFQGNVVSGDQFVFAGGTFTGNFTNNNPATLQITGSGMHVFNGSLTNNSAIVSITGGGTLKISGNVTTTGSITSDTASVSLDSLQVGTSGYVAAAGGSFTLAGDLLSTSTQNTNWNTSQGKLAFTGDPGTLHVLSIDGADLGNNLAGYVNNFAWGTLELGSGQSLYLTDGNLTSGGALYVQSLKLDDGISQINSITFNGLHIYYDPNLPDNAYLDGESFQTADGGISPVPEPSAAILLAIVGAGILCRRRRYDRAMNTPAAS